MLRAVRSVARLGDLGVPGMFSSECGDGACCAAFREDLHRAAAADVRAVAIYSRSDGIVVVARPASTRAPSRSRWTRATAECRSTATVYRVLARILDEEAQRWTG